MSIESISSIGLENCPPVIVGEPLPLVVALDRVKAEDVPRVGGKGANLGAMLAAGLPVPRGFCITTAAFQQFVDSCREIGPLCAALGAIGRAADRQGADPRRATATAAVRRAAAPGRRTGRRRRVAGAGHASGLCRAIQRHGRGSAPCVVCRPRRDISQCPRTRGHSPQRPRLLGLAVRRSGGPLPDAQPYRASHRGNGGRGAGVDRRGRLGRALYRRSGQRQHAADGDRGRLRPGTGPGFRRGQPRSPRALPAGTPSARSDTWGKRRSRSFRMAVPDCEGTPWTHSGQERPAWTWPPPDAWGCWPSRRNGAGRAARHGVGRRRRADCSCCNPVPSPPWSGKPANRKPSGAT